MTVSAISQTFSMSLCAMKCTRHCTHIIIIETKQLLHKHDAIHFNAFSLLTQHTIHYKTLLRIRQWSFYIRFGDEKRKKKLKKWQKKLREASCGWEQKKNGTAQKQNLVLLGRKLKIMFKLKRSKVSQWWKKGFEHKFSLFCVRLVSLYFLYVYVYV